MMPLIDNELEDLVRYQDENGLPAGAYWEILYLGLWMGIPLLILVLVLVGVIR